MGLLTRSVGSFETLPTQHHAQKCAVCAATAHALSVSCFVALSFLFVRCGWPCAAVGLVDTCLCRQSVLWEVCYGRSTCVGAAGQLC